MAVGKDTDYSNLSKDSLLEKIQQLTERNSQLSEKIDQLGGAAVQRADPNPDAEPFNHFEYIFNQLNDAVFLTEFTKGGPRNFSEVNDEACRRLGYTRAELLQKSIVDISTQDGLKRMPDILRRLKEQNHVVFSARHIARDGREIPVEVSSTRFSREGKTFVLSIARDVSERLSKEAELDTQNRFLTDVIESLKHPFYVIDAKTYQIVLSNSFAGIRSGDLCYRKTHHREKPCHHHGEACPLKIIVETKEPTVVEHRHLDQNGNEQFFEVHGYPVFDSEGNVSQIIEYTLDISEKKKVALELKESVEKFKAFTNQSGEGITVADLEGNYVFVNPAFCRMSGYSEAELLNMTVFDMKSANQSHQSFFESKGDKEGVPIQVRLKRKDGSEYMTEIIGNVINVGDRQLVHGTIRDISERIRMEEALKRSEEHYRNFFENALVGLFRSRLSDGLFLKINARAAKILEMPNSEVEGIIYTRDLYSNKSERDELVRILKAKGEIHGYETGMILPNGKEIVVSLSVRAYPDKDYLEGAVIDVTEKKRIQEELRIERELIATAIDTMTDTFFVFNPFDGKAIRWNRAFKRVCGYEDQEIRQLNAPESYYGPADLEKARLATEKLMKGESELIEMDLLTKEGRKIPSEYSAGMIRDESGEPQYIVSIGRDISDRKESEARLKQSEVQYRNLVDMIPYGIEEVDLTGTIVFSNDAHHRIHGLKPGELIGRKIWDFAISSEDRKKNRRFFKYLIRNRPTPKPFFSKNHNKNGDIIDIRLDWGYKWGPDGELSGFISIVTDVTEQKKAFRETENLAGILRQSTDSIVLTDLEGNIVYVNPMFEKVTGYSFEEVNGKNPRILKADALPYPADYYRKMWETLERGEVWEGEFINKKKNDEMFIEEASIFPFRDDETGEITGYGTVKKDVTESRRLAEKLKQSYEEVVKLKEKAEAANRMKSQFLANMSHDIRTPINAVMGFTDLLYKNEKRQESRQYLLKIKNAGEGLLNLINDILDFSKIEAGQLDIYPETFELQDLIRNIESIFNIQFKEKGVDFKTQVLTDLPDLVHNDKWRLNQVLTNLLSNALKFTDAGEVILSIRYRVQLDRLIFDVKDSGIGISPENINQIFDPFIQLDHGSHMVPTGAGLGLAICRKLVDLMGGSIVVFSELGKGTTFKVEIPVDSETVETYIQKGDEKKADEIDLERKRGNTILVVEDNPVNLELIVEQLKDAGLNKLLTAVNGKEAVAIALEKKPDLVLMDNQMPVMDGNTAISLLKEQGFENPIIILSAFAMREDIERSLKIGAVDYITKPLNFELFFNQISKYLKIKKPVSEGKAENIDRRYPSGRKIEIKSSVSERIRMVFLTDLEKKRSSISAVLETGMTDENRKLLYSIAHGYQGNADYLGLSDLLDMSTKLEQMIQDEEPDGEILRYTSQLMLHLDEIYEANRDL